MLVLSQLVHQGAPEKDQIDDAQSSQVIPGKFLAPTGTYRLHVPPTHQPHHYAREDSQPVLDRLNGPRRRRTTRWSSGMIESDGPPAVVAFA